MRRLSRLWLVLVKVLGVPGRQIVRISSFFLKEIWAAIRQPRLILSVVLGPFLILAAFGVGYKGQSLDLRTMVALPNDPRFPEDPAAYQDLFSSAVFKLEQVTRDRRAAEEALAAGQVQVVVVVPNEPEEQVLNGQHAEFEVLFNEIDPLQAAWVRYFATVAVGELNRRVLAGMVGNGQQPAEELAGAAGRIRGQADGLDADLRSGNVVGAGARVVALRQTLAAARSTPAFSPILAIVGNQADPVAPIEADLSAIEADLRAGRVNTSEQLARAQRLRTSSQDLEVQARRLTDIPPDVLVAPFSVEARNVVREPSAIAYFTPAVIALLLQHIAVSLSSLSMVRDRLLGAMDVYRVAPIGPLEVLLGKSLSYGLLLSIVAALLVVLINRGLGVPIQGDVRWVAASLGLVLFASLGMGFFISTLANTETQAVQIAMLVLLCSIFFGGFFLALNTLFPWVHTISYALPVTYGAIDLRDVMLRGKVPDQWMLVAPALLGLGLYIAAAWSVSRDMATQ